MTEEKEREAAKIVELVTQLLNDHNVQLPPAAHGVAFNRSSDWLQLGGLQESIKQMSQSVQQIAAGQTNTDAKLTVIGRVTDELKTDVKMLQDGQLKLERRMDLFEDGNQVRKELTGQVRDSTWKTIAAIMTTITILMGFGTFFWNLLSSTFQHAKN